jgi:uncharacterized protein YecT (DUF1311 family)
MIKKVIAAVLFGIVFCSYASSPDYDKCVANDTPLSECSLAAYSIQDKRLNTAYKAAIKLHPELKNAQREWIKSRDKSCTKPSEDNETYHLLDMYYSCLFEVTEKRAIELESLSQQGIIEIDTNKSVSKSTSPEEVLADELRSGKKEIQSNREAMLAYSAENAGQLLITPKIKPDDGTYGAIFRIVASNDDNSFIAEIDSGQRFGKNYAQIIIPTELKDNYLKTAQIGQLASIIGKYIENRQYTNVQGEYKTMPVFNAIHFLCCLM